MILIAFFGPTFVFTYRYLSKLSQASAKKLQDAFLDVSAQFSIPVCIAAVVRLRQFPPFFETSFLLSLTTMQFLGLLSTALATGVCAPKKLDSRRIMIISMYLIVDFAFYIGVVAQLRTGKKSWQAIQDMGKACASYHSIPPGFSYIQSMDLGKLFTFHSFLSFLNPLKKFFAMAAIVALVAAAIYCLVVFVAIVSEVVKSRHPFLWGPLSLAFMIGTLYCMIMAEKKRNVLKAITSSDYQDNEWGFGQVIAMFLWAPLFIQALYYTLRE